MARCNCGNGPSSRTRTGSLRSTARRRSDAWATCTRTDSSSRTSAYARTSSLATTTRPSTGAISCPTPWSRCLRSSRCCTACRQPSPVASASVLRSPALWPPRRRCCCWTSPWPRWTYPRGGASCGGYGRCTRRRASRWSTSPTRCRRSGRWRNRRWCSTTEGRWPWTPLRGCSIRGPCCRCWSRRTWRRCSRAAWWPSTRTAG